MVRDSDKIINCLDITDEHDYLFVGYNSGNINIYDLKKNVCKYSANKIHNNIYTETSGKYKITNIGKINNNIQNTIKNKYIIINTQIK